MAIEVVVAASVADEVSKFDQPARNDLRRFLTSDRLVSDATKLDRETYVVADQRMVVTYRRPQPTGRLEILDVTQLSEDIPFSE